MTQIRNLGRIDGSMLVFGGPYSNLQALDAFLDVASGLGVGPERIICTGDVVAYGADGEACATRIRTLGIPVVAGNCERQLAQGADDCGCGFEDGSTCDILSAGWYAHARKTLSAENLAWMGRCPDVITFEDDAGRTAVIHGGVSDIARFIWSVDSDDVFRTEIDSLRSLGPVDRVIAGHSGIGFIRDVDGVRWINAGTIGMPENDGQSQTRYLRVAGRDTTLHRLAYDVTGAQGAMVAAGLVQGYHTALGTGFWPSEDVLPASLRRAAL